jgi:hypothetical protein
MPPKSSIKLPEKRYDDTGKVKNWSSLWPEAKELETIVAAGFVDGLTTAQIFSKYPHFGEQFQYKPFNSGLTNIRSKHNKEVKTREEYAASGGVCESYGLLCCCYCRRRRRRRIRDFSNNILSFVSVEGVKAHASAFASGPDRCAPGDDEATTIADDMSRMSILDDDGVTLSGATFRSNARSVRFQDDGGSRKSDALNRKKIVLSYIMAPWIDKNLRKRVSLRVKMISGCTQQLEWRVSTDQRNLILFQPLDHELLSPEDSFIQDVYDKHKNNQEMLPLLKEVLDHHPLVLAMKASIAREKGRDINKREVIDSVRIPLPIKVMHSPATVTDDGFFSGVEFIAKSDGSSFMTFHLIGEMKDGYSPMRTPPQQHSSPARPSSITSRSSATSSPVVVGGPLGGTSGAAGCAMSVDGDDEDFSYQS